ncbi:MAG: MarR family transcriptional regulator [Candidatus Nitrosocaldaceae archaeon]
MSSEKKEKKEKKAQEKQKTDVSLQENTAMKILSNMKAINAYELARTTGVKISIANAFLKSLESKGSIEYVGGYSGHKVYKLKR